MVMRAEVRGSEAPYKAYQAKASAHQMAGALREAGVTVPVKLEKAIEKSPERMAALRQTSGFTTFQHILNVAQAGKLADGRPSAQFALHLFESVGTPGHSADGVWSASQAVFTMTRPAAYARMMGELAVHGQMSLPSGTVLRWDPAADSSTLRDHLSDESLPASLWTGMNQTTTKLGGGGPMTPEEYVKPHQVFPTYASAARAFHADLVKGHGRMMGTKHVAVLAEGNEAAINAYMKKNGPLLAVAGPRTAAIKAVGGDGGFEVLQPTKGKRDKLNGLDVAKLKLDFVVMPADAAKEANLSPIEFRQPGAATKDSFG